MSLVQSKTMTEEDLQFRILDWVNLCKNNSGFNIEVPLLVDGVLRRIDFIEDEDDDTITGYELKMNAITSRDIATVIGERGYVEMLKKTYPSKKIFFGFISPKGVTDDGRRLWHFMINTNLLIWNVKDFCEGYFEIAENTKWRSNMIQLRKMKDSERFRCLFEGE